MGALRTIALSEEEVKSLKHGYKTGQTHVYRQRCRMVLLKSEGLSSREVGRMTGYSLLAVNGWLNRYEAEGIEGLRTKPGRGRRALLNKEQDGHTVERIVREHRQSLDTAKCELEKELGKSFSKKTLVRFLKVASTAATSAYGNDR